MIEVSFASLTLRPCLRVPEGRRSGMGMPTNLLSRFVSTTNINDGPMTKLKTSEGGSDQEVVPFPHPMIAFPLS